MAELADAIDLRSIAVRRVGSTPTLGKIFIWRGSQVVRQRSAKALYAGSIPARASGLCPRGGIGRRARLRT